MAKMDAFPEDGHGDTDWAQLRQLSGLPNEAREAVERVIGFLRAKPSLQHSRKRSVLQSRKVIEAAIATGLPNAIKAMDELIGQKVDRFMFRPLVVSSDKEATGIRVSRGELEEVRNRLKEYALMLECVRLICPL